MANGGNARIFQEDLPAKLSLSRSLALSFPSGSRYILSFATHDSRLNLSLKPSLETSLFHSNSSWGNSGQFHEKIQELTLTQDCIPQTAEVITKRATKMAHMHASERNILLNWQVSALTAILQLYNSRNTTNNAETGLITLAVAATLSVFSPGKSDVRRVLIVFREASKYKIVSKYINNAYNSGRYIMLNVLIDNDPVVLVNYREQELRLIQQCCPAVGNHRESACNRNEKDIFAVAVAETNEIKLYDKGSFCAIGPLQGHSETITGLSFCPSNPNLLWSSSLDATVRCWDVREDRKKTVQNLTGDANEAFTSMDVNCTGEVVCAGTEQQEDGDSFLYIWDIRNLASVLTKNDDCHSDDVTQVKFHPTNPVKLATGSTDGLVSICDISATEVGDMLEQTLNTESSVSCLGFFGPTYEFLYSLTHIETVQFWNYNEGDLLGRFDDVREGSKDQVSIDYIVDCFYHSPSSRLFLVAGTHGGKIEVLHANLDDLQPYVSLHGGHSSTVRCIHYDKKTNSLLTGGEDGMVSLWTATDDFKRDNDLKERQSHKTPKPKSHGSKPYKKKAGKSSRR